MSILKNLSNEFVPVRERREISGTLASVNDSLVLDVNGDASATISIYGGGGTLNATYVVEGSMDGTVYGSLLAFPNPPFCAGGTIPSAAQPMLLEAVNAASLRRVLHVAVGGLKKLRVRMSAFTAGSADVLIVSDTNDSINPYIRDQKTGTLLVTVTAASGVAATATLPAVAGLRHYLDQIFINRSYTALATASATPTVVTTSNIPGALAFTFGADAGAQGTDQESGLNFGGAGAAATALGVATTVVCPATPNVIWRVVVAYRLGL